MRKDAKHASACGLYEEISSEHFKQQNGSWHLYSRKGKSSKLWCMTDSESSMEAGKFKIMSGSDGARPEDVSVWKVYGKGEVTRDPSITVRKAAPRVRKRAGSDEAVKRRRVDTPEQEVERTPFSISTQRIEVEYEEDSPHLGWVAGEEAGRKFVVFDDTWNAVKISSKRPFRLLGQDPCHSSGQLWSTEEIEKLKDWGQCVSCDYHWLWIAASLGRVGPKHESMDAVANAIRTYYIKMTREGYDLAEAELAYVSRSWKRSFFGIVRTQLMIGRGWVGVMKASPR